MRAKTILFILLCALLLTSCNGIGGPQPTPQPASPEQISKDLINQVNDYLINYDQIGYALDTKFQAVDASYTSGGNNQLNGLTIAIDCQGLCSNERTIAMLIQALKNKYGALRAIALPDTLKDLSVIMMKDMQATGKLDIKWKDVSDYLNNTIAGTQLATRLKSKITNP